MTPSIAITRLLCTRCGHRKPPPFFALRSSGRPYSWCRQCKREYDRLAAQRKRLKEQNSEAKPLSTSPQEGTEAKAST